MIKRILIADDHKIVRDGLRNLLETQSDMKLIAEAEDGPMTIELTQQLKPDVVIMDISMPGLNGIEATNRIVNTIPDVKIIALSMYSERRFVVGMLKSGALGYLLKDCAFDDLSKAIRAVCKDQIYLSPKIVEYIAQDFLNHFREQAIHNISLLENQEGKMLQLLAQGKSKDQISSELAIDIKKFDTYCHDIVNKWMLICS